MPPVLTTLMIRSSKPFNQDPGLLDINSINEVDPELESLSGEKNDQSKESYVFVTRVEQAVVYSTLPQEYSTLTFKGEVVADGGGVEERSEMMYCHKGAYIIYYRDITCHSYTA